LEKSEVYTTVWCRNLKEGDPQGRSRRGWKNGIKMGVKEIE
jgi:hypothetical protein